MKKLLDNVWFCCEDPFSANTYIFVWKQKALIIDPGFYENGRVALEFLRNRGVNEIIVVLTHCHYDHIASAPLFEKENAIICAHELDAEYIRKSDSITTVAIAFNAEWNGCKISRILRDGDTIDMEIFKFKVIHTPGHTRGSICLYEPSHKILVSGDTVFSGGAFGRCDLPTGDLRKIVSSLEKLSSLNVEILFPGHGNPVMFRAKEHIILAFKRAKRSLEELA